MIKLQNGVSRTGVIHRTLGPVAAVCSSGNRGLRTSYASDDTVARTPASKFCKKCFPNGKPE
ncbi:hypothetical protein ACIPSD_20800 [Pectobacterium sp. CHL-2024]|uniref:hypothetical protein n=1 Tax=Pectobacterium sp. CHL-2024 TaxID=3377079 RepID=UPI0038190E64